MDWNEFKSSPSAFVLGRKLNIAGLVKAMTQVVVSEQEKDEQLKVLILTTWQEMAPLLFKDTRRLESTISTLNDLFKQQRSSAGAFFLSQILCTITSLLVLMEELLAFHEIYLVEFVVLLFEIIEKVKSESNLLLKSMACDCLTELESSYPGLLASKVGHFYGMSQAENSYMHQHYTLLFTTVLENVVKKFILQQSDSNFNAQDSILDLLSYTDHLKAFSLPENFKKYSEALLAKPQLSNGLNTEALGEVRKGILSIIDNSYLMTPSCLANVAQKLISIVECCETLSPKVLKRLLSLSSSHNIQLLDLVLTLQAKFGADICDIGDEQTIKTHHLIHAGHPQLSNEHRVMVWQWLLERLEAVEPRDDSTSPVSDEGSPVVEPELSAKVMNPSIFDSMEIFQCKCKALFIEDKLHQPSVELPKSIREVLGHVLKLVQYDVMGQPVHTLYELLLAYLINATSEHSMRFKEVEKLVLDVTLAHPQLIPHTIEFIEAVHNKLPHSSIPLNVLSEITQYLATVDLSQILLYLELYLQFIRQAATNPHISPTVLIQLLLRMLKESTICSTGLWDTGNAVLDICTTIMQLHKTELIFKGLSELLLLLCEEYKDLDIRDRAKFYHQLLLSVSGEKLCAILSLPSDTASSSNLAAIVEARISDNVFPSAPPVKSLSNSESFLTLTRVPASNSNCHYSQSEDSQTEDVIKLYCEEICSGDDEIKKRPIELQYMISYEKRIEELSQKIFALVLKLSTTGPYHSSPDIFVPCLCADGGSESSKIVSVLLYPKQPVPADFNVSVTFSTEGGVSFCAALEPIKLDFSDLFQPVSIPASVSASSLFEALWKSIKDAEQKESAESVLSTMHLTMDHNNWNTTFSILKTFEVLSTASQGVHRVLVFLPPHYHLLMCFNMSNDGSQVTMATDSWEVLPLTHSFIKKFS